MLSFCLPLSQPCSDTHCNIQLFQSKELVINLNRPEKFVCSLHQFQCSWRKKQTTVLKTIKESTMFASAKPYSFNTQGCWDLAANRTGMDLAAKSILDTWPHLPGSYYPDILGRGHWPWESEHKHLSSQCPLCLHILYVSRRSLGIKLSCLILEGFLKPSFPFF